MPSTALAVEFSSPQQWTSLPSLNAESGSATPIMRTRVRGRIALADDRLMATHIRENETGEGPGQDTGSPKLITRLRA